MGEKNVRHRAVGAGAAAVLFNDKREPIREALLVAQAPGNQTVPRAEAWAVSCTLEVWPGKKPRCIITDASYVIQRVLGAKP